MRRVRAVGLLVLLLVVAPRFSPSALDTRLTPQELEYVRHNCPFGMPTELSAWKHGAMTVIAREGYVLDHSAADKIPLWVCEGVSADQPQGDVVRRNRFRPDPKLPRGKRAELIDYRNSGYDKGHMAPAGDQKSRQDLADETFYLSNMAPQKPAFNRQVWEKLEEMVRCWARERSFVYVITGPIFYYPTSGIEPGMLPNDTIGPDHVAVPTHFYKIVVAKHAQGPGRLSRSCWRTGGTRKGTRRTEIGVVFSRSIFSEGQNMTPALQDKMVSRAEVMEGTPGAEHVPVPLAYSEQDAAKLLGISERLLALQRRRRLISCRIIGGSAKGRSRKQTGDYVYEMLDLVNFLRQQPRIPAKWESDHDAHGPADGDAGS